MKKIIFTALVSLCVTVCAAQINHLNTFVTPIWLNNFFQNNYQIHSGEYDEYNDIFKDCEIVGNIPNWGVKIETNANGRIKTIVYKYNKYKSHSVMNSGDELIRMSNNIFQDPRIKIVKKEYNQGNINYEGILRSTSSYRYKTIRITGRYDYNDFGVPFFRYYTVYYIMTGN